MKFGWVVFFLVLFGLAHTATSAIKEPHQFSEKECGMCHLDINKNPVGLKAMSSSACESCHSGTKQKLSHPIDISPKISVPPDMPLEDGRLGCITCHFVHPFSNKLNKFSYSLLRKPGKGKIFCNVCHKFNENSHIVYENLHIESYRLGNLRSSFDTYTLQCIECHADKIATCTGFVYAGKWQHNSSLKFNNKIGVSYVRISNIKPRKFNPRNMLSPKIRLVNDKIGCGTCHNASSREKFMLVMSNERSRLCFGCHIK